MEYTLIPIFSSLGFFFMVVAIVYLVTHSRQQLARYQTEVQTKLIERFGSAPELVTFLQSSEGRQFLGTVEAAPKYLAGDRILAGVRKSVVLSFLGVAFLLLCIPYGIRNEFFMVTGGILLALGAGYFVSTVISFRLSKSWGLVTSTHDPSSLAQS
ncbi:MAG TPA: hypothetical protein VN605_05220 [Thermoanaerobaculia bacterium]|nr:hypothetical protein [Thermoanaerobaculia bacterium]